MTKYIALSKALFKNSFSFVDQGIKKKSNNYLVLALFVFLLLSLLPALAGLYQLTGFILEQLKPLNQTGVLMALTFQGAGLIIFFFAVFMIPALFYFSKDIEQLLSLPLKPFEIIAAKFTVTYVYQTIIMLLILAPILVSYSINMPLNTFEIILLILIVLTLPLLPLILSSLLVMVVMWLVPLFKNRDLFNMLSGLIVLALALLVNFSMDGLETLTQEQLIDFIIEGNDSLIQMFRFIFFTYPFAIEGFLRMSIVNVVLYFTLTFATLAVFLTFSNIIYFRGVLGVNETASSRKHLSEKQWQSSSRKSPAFIRYFFKEVILLVRTPIYFLNCVSIQFLLPILLIASFVAVPDQQKLIIDTLSTFDFSAPATISMVLIISLSVGLILGSVNMISSTAISREGQNLYFMKIIPMPIMVQLHAKVASGVFFSLIGVIVTLSIFLFYITIPILLIVASFLMAFVGVVFINYFSVLVDVIRPKLVWESEQAAVKQNMNAVFTMLPSMAIGALIIYVAINEWLSSYVFLFALFIILVSATAFIIMLLQRKAHDIIVEH